MMMHEFTGHSIPVNDYVKDEDETHVSTPQPQPQPQPQPRKIKKRVTFSSNLYEISPNI